MSDITKFIIEDFYDIWTNFIPSDSVVSINGKDELLVDKNFSKSYFSTLSFRDGEPEFKYYSPSKVLEPIYTTLLDSKFPAYFLLKSHLAKRGIQDIPPRN